VLHGISVTDGLRAQSGIVNTYIVALRLRSPFCEFGRPSQERASSQKRHIIRVRVFPDSQN